MFEAGLARHCAMSCARNGKTFPLLAREPSRPKLSPRRAARNGYGGFKNTTPISNPSRVFFRRCPRPSQPQRRRPVAGDPGVSVQAGWGSASQSAPPGTAQAGKFSTGCPSGSIARSWLPQANTFQEERAARLPVPDAELGSMCPVDSSGMLRFRNPSFLAPPQPEVGAKKGCGAGLRVAGNGSWISGFDGVIPGLMHFSSVFHRTQDAPSEGREPDQAPFIHPFLLRREFRSAYPHLLLA
jgi:hypothetical protein